MEKRVKDKALVLDTGNGGTIRLELFAASQWPEQSAGEGLYRVRVDGKWHCPTGKYSFLTREALGDLCLDLLFGHERPGPQPLPAPLRRKGCRVTILYGPCDDGLPQDMADGWTITPAHLAADGRYWVWCYSPETKEILVSVDDIRLRGQITGHSLPVGEGK